MRVLAHVRKKIVDSRVVPVVSVIKDGYDFGAVKKQSITSKAKLSRHLFFLRDLIVFLIRIG